MKFRCLIAVVFLCLASTLCRAPLAHAQTGLVPNPYYPLRQELKEFLGYRFIIFYTDSGKVLAYNSPEDEEYLRQFQERYPGLTLEFLGMTLQEKMDLDLYCKQLTERARASRFGEVYDFDIFFSMNRFVLTVCVYDDPNHIDFITSDFREMVTDDPRFTVTKSSRLADGGEEYIGNPDMDVEEATPDRDLRF